MTSDGVKSTNENVMESNDGTPSPHGSENEGTCFLDDSLNKNIPSKKYLGCLMKRASTLRSSEKQVLRKRIKAAINKCFLKYVFWRFKQAITDCIKFRPSPWESSDGVHV